MDGGADFMKVFFIPAIIVAVLLVSPVFAVDLKPKQNCDFCRGWYWYDAGEPEKKDAEKDPRGELPNPYIPPPLRERFTPVQLMDLHPQQIKVVGEQYLEKAIWRPTPQNNGDFMVVLDVMRRKGMSFSNSMTWYVQTHPQYNLMKDAPDSAPGINAMSRANLGEMERVVASARGDFGLFYFQSPRCVACVEQKPVLRYFLEKFGWEVVDVDVTADPENALRFNVQDTPTIVLAYPGKDSWMPVTVGFSSYDELLEQTYNAIRYLRGEITEIQWTMNGVRAGGPFDPSVVPDFPAERR
jgi:thiol-disulfide isomerase/thioredoxin